MYCFIFSWKRIARRSQGEYKFYTLFLFSVQIMVKESFMGSRVSYRDGKGHKKKKEGWWSLDKGSQGRRQQEAVGGVWELPPALDCWDN